MEHSITKLKVTMTHLSQELKSINWSDQQIANKLKRHRSTTYREQKRNKGQRGYRSKQANVLARERRYVQSQYFRVFEIAFVEYLLSEKWSPEQIHGALTARGWLDVPRHEWIYQHLYAYKKAGGQLHKHLRAQKPYKNRSSTNERHGCGGEAQRCVGNLG